VGFVNEVFPLNVQRGHRSEFGIPHGVVELRSGAHEYTAHAADLAHDFEVAFNVKSPSEMTAFKNFYAMVGGISNSFPVRDPLDMNTSSAPYVLEGGPGAVATDDVVQVPGASASQTQFQLVKRYQSTGAAPDFVRTISLPKSGTLLVQTETVPGGTIVNHTEGSGFTCDYATGIVTMSSAMVESTIVRAGFEFYVRCRMGIDAQKISVALEAWSIAGIAVVPLVHEIEGVAHQDDFDYGGGSIVTAANISWSPAIHGRATTWRQTGAGTVVMPDPDDFEVGGVYGIFKNESASSVTFKDGSLATLFTLTAGTGALVCVMDDTVRTWVAF
jgi:uncharacterized protein (TIGR02217 family)